MADTDNKNNPIVTTTQITIAGQAFELKDMSAEDGAKLYNALAKLPNHNYVQLADQVGQLALNFQTLVDIPVPTGLGRIQDALTKLGASLKKGAGKLSDDASPELKKFYDNVKSVPFIGAMCSTTEGAVQFSTLLVNFSGPMRAIMTPGSTYDALENAVTTSTKEGWTSLFGSKMSAKEAHAFGAAYAAAYYAQMEGPATKVDPGQPNLWDNISVWTSHTWQSMSHEWPVSLVAILPAIGKFISNIIDGKGFNWSAAWDEAKAEVTAAHAKPVASQQEMMNERMLGKTDDKARPLAADLMAASHTIAGIKTDQISKIISDGHGIYQAPDGTWNTLEFKDGKPVSTPLKDSDGNVITTKSRVKQAWANAGEAVNLPDGNPASNPYGYAAYGLGAYPAYRTAKGVVKGFVKGTAEELVGTSSRSHIASDKAATEYSKLMEESEHAANGKAGIKVFNHTIGGKGSSPENAAKLEAKAEKSLEKAQTLFERAEERDASYIGKLRPLTHGGKTMVEIANETHVPVKAGQNWLTKTGDWFENAGHWFGRKVLGKTYGNISDRAENITSHVAGHTQETLEVAGEKAIAKYGAKAVMRFASVGIPVAGEVIGAHEDITASYKAYKNGKPQEGLHKGLRAMTEMSGGWAMAEIGAQAGIEGGAMLGAPAEGVGAIPGAILGGIVGGIGGFFGAQWIADKANEYSEKHQKPVHFAPTPKLHVDTKSDVKADVKADVQKHEPELHAALVDKTYKLQAKLAGTAMTAHKVQIGATHEQNAPKGSTGSITQTQQQLMPRV